MNKNKIPNKAFSVAEIMIALTVIGVITAVILPIAIQSKPDENIIKFKKAHNSLHQAISSILNSNKYYCRGDLGKKSDCTTLVTGSAFFCITLSDTLSVKNKACNKSEGIGAKSFVRVGSSESSQNPYKKPSEAKKQFDEDCNNSNAVSVGEEIVTPDGVVFYQTSPTTTFGMYDSDTGSEKRLFSNPLEAPTYPDEVGFDSVYKVICIDVDGLNKGESAFGYGIRADGKILSGDRADAWLNKDIQEN